MHAVILDKASSIHKHAVGAPEPLITSQTSSTRESEKQLDRQNQADLDPSRTFAAPAKSPEAGMPHSQTPKVPWEDSKAHSTGYAHGSNSHATINQQHEELSGHLVQISISHDGEYATAVCLAVQEPSEGDVGGEAAARDHL